MQLTRVDDGLDVGIPHQSRVGGWPPSAMGSHVVGDVPLSGGHGAIGEVATVDSGPFVMVLDQVRADEREQGFGVGNPRLRRCVA